MTRADLDVEEAIDEVQGMQGYTGALARRAVGLTWVLWGLVLAGMVLSYNQWAQLGAQTPDALDGLLRFLFVPWLGLGAFVTWLLWRTVGLAIPGETDRSGLFWAGVLSAIALVAVAGVFVANNLSSDVTSTAILLVGIGLPTAFAGLAGLLGRGRGERAVPVAIGSFVVVATLAVSWLGEPGSSELFLTFTWLGPTLVLVAYISGGAALAVRG